MLEIRPMTDADAQAAAEMHVATWRAAYEGIVPGEFLAALQPSRIVARRRSYQHSKLLVAVRDGTVVGNADYGPYRRDDGTIDHGHGELNAIYVAPGEWGRGTGKALLRAAGKEMTGTWPDMRLWVLEDNVRARAFYERNGLFPDGESDLWTPSGTSAQLRELRYSKAL